MMFFNKKLHAKIAALESVVSRQTNTIDQLILDKRSLQRQVTDLHAQREVLSRRVTPDSSKQFHPMGNQNAVKKTHATERPSSTSRNSANYEWPTSTHSPAIPDMPSSLRAEPFSGGGGSFGGGGASGSWADSSSSSSSSSCNSSSSDSGSSSCSSGD